MFLLVQKEETTSTPFPYAIHFDNTIGSSHLHFDLCFITPKALTEVQKFASDINSSKLEGKNKEQL